LCDDSSKAGEAADTPVLKMPRSSVIYSNVRGDGVGDPGAGGRNIGRPVPCCGGLIGLLFNVGELEKVKGGILNGLVPGKGLEGRGELLPDGIDSSSRLLCGFVAIGCAPPPPAELLLPV
jgi:hypothetical protein